MRRFVLDLETYDPYLTAKTPPMGTDAHARRFGSYVFMVGLYNLDTEELEIGGLELFEKVRGILDACDSCLIGANLKYDLNWLFSEGVLLPSDVKRGGTMFEDILINAALIDETQPPKFYSLNSQAELYGYPAKPIDMLLDSAKSAGVKCDAKSVRGKLHLLPKEAVASYLEYDLRSTAHVWRAQQPLLDSNKLRKVWALECELLPVLSMMERQGVRVDVPAAEKLYEDINVHVVEIKNKLRDANNGFDVPLSASGALTQFLLDRGHRLPNTPKSTEEKVRYCTDATVLEGLAKIDPLISDIVLARKAHKIGNDFCKNAVVENAVNGRIYANINQIIAHKEGTGDGQGVRFGRLSYSGPNLQQVPKRDSVEFDETGGLGSAMRSLFIAEEGCSLMSADFSSQEPRWIIHWAETWGIKEAFKVGDQYRADPSVSSHRIVANSFDIPGLSEDAKYALAKVINLGKGYEMGRDKLVAGLNAKGATGGMADEILKVYAAEFPHVSIASRSAMGVAEKLGYVRTAFGRKIHFNLWEPVIRGKGPALPELEARRRYVDRPSGRIPIKRAFCYRAFNRIVQGSSADQTKYCMVVLWYDHGVLPTMQIHDELVDAAIDNVDKVWLYKEVMENAIKLTVPLLTECKVGPSWGSAEVLK